MSNVGQALRVAFAGFRHGHIMDVHAGVAASGEMDIVACCEEDSGTRDALIREGVVSITHDNIKRMLDQVDCDAVAIGDYYGKRGSIIIEALKRGKHVIVDKPVCTRLEELDEIETLVMEKGLSLGCQLDMRDKGQFIRLRELSLAGAVGEIHAITFGGQHPLLPESRPSWYFEEGKHGGTINDIGIHAIDLIPWMTGLSFKAIVAARRWNALAHDYPHMHDAGQFMLCLSNGAGVVGDVSYLMPGAMGYGMDQYWRLTVWGAKGIMETSIAMDGVDLSTTVDQQRQRVASAPGFKQGYLAAFLSEIRGKAQADALTTRDVITASRWALQIEQAAALNRACCA